MTITDAMPSADEAFASAPWPAAICDDSLRILRVNNDITRRFGQVVGTSLVELISPENHSELCAAASQVYGGADAGGIEVAVRSVAGWPMQVHLSRCGEHWLSAWLRPAFDDARQSELIRAHGRRFEALCASAPAGILCADSGMRVDFVNDRCAGVFGTRNPDDLWGFGWLDYLAEPTDVARATESIDLAANGRTVGPVELQIRRPDNTVRVVEARFAPIGAHDGGFVATVEDVTDARTLAAQLEAQAVRDPLTGLPNRRSMLAALTQMIERGEGAGSAVIFVDLDNFKDINDTLGHAAGDELLVQVARRMSGCLRENDVVARFGGDEFVVLLPVSAVTAGSVAERLVRAIAQPILLDDKETAITASAGIVPVGQSGDAEDLLRQADIAMYQAKRAGKNRVMVFDASERGQDERRLEVVRALRHALSTNSADIDVRYQPICDVDANVHGLEALLRWFNPELGEVSPGEFIPMAESVGLVDQLGALVRERAFADLAVWQADGWEGHLSINLSAGEFTNPHLVSTVADQLLRHRVAPDSIVVELTETTMMGDVAETQRILRDITALGIRVAIDDFGTGYSSLAYLRRFPVSVVKVDREFVADIESSEEDQAICASIVALADALGLSVVAEGVETAEERDVLSGLGVRLMQGWWFSAAVRREHVPALIAATP